MPTVCNKNNKTSMDDLTPDAIAFLHWNLWSEIKASKNKTHIRKNPRDFSLLQKHDLEGEMLKTTWRLFTLKQNHLGTVSFQTYL